MHSYANEGRYIVSLIVSDGQSRSAATAGTRSFASATVTGASLDTIPPITTAVSAPPGGSDGWNTTDVVVDLTAVDNPGGSGVRDISMARSGAEIGDATAPGAAARLVVTREGTTALTWFATDNAGNRESPQQRVVRIDRTGPTITGMPLKRCTLWPPNHQLVKVAKVRASDDASGLAPAGLVLTATSSEPDDASGDGHTGPDIVITDGFVYLRAERSGTGPGRTYTIRATATDRAGNTTQAVSVCVVPHDQSPKPGDKNVPDVREQPKTQKSGARRSVPESPRAAGRPPDAEAEGRIHCFPSCPHRLLAPRLSSPARRPASAPRAPKPLRRVAAWSSPACAARRTERR